MFPFCRAPLCCEGHSVVIFFLNSFPLALAFGDSSRFAPFFFGLFGRLDPFPLFFFFSSLKEEVSFMIVAIVRFTVISFLLSSFPHLF